MPVQQADRLREVLAQVRTEALHSAIAQAVSVAVSATACRWVGLYWGSFKAPFVTVEWI